MFVLPLARPLPRRLSLRPVWSHAIERSTEEQARATGGSTAAQVPAMDVAESDAGYTLSFDMPGLSREHVKVSVEGRTVDIEAARDDTPQSAADQRLLRRERSAPRYARQLTLPVDLDPAASAARVENGVLTLTLAKKVPDGARKISVQ